MNMQACNVSQGLVFTLTDEDVVQSFWNLLR